MSYSHRYQPFQPLLTNAGRKSFGLSVQQCPAHSSLTRVVHSYLQITSSGATPYPIMPDGTQAIFISSEASQIGGVQTQAMDLQIHQAGDYFGIRFYPGALRHFFNLNLSEITGQLVDEQYFPCRYFPGLAEDIYRQADFMSRVGVCERWLLHNFAPRGTDRFDVSLDLIYQSLGTIEVNALSKKTGMSSRHLNRLYQQHIGISTKNFAQIVRIQNASKQLFNKPDDSLEVALALGFYDQAHFLKEYKRQLLLSPRLLYNRFMSDIYNIRVA